MAAIALVIVAAVPAVAGEGLAPGELHIDPDRSQAGFTLDSTWHLVTGEGGRLEGELRILPSEDGGTLPLEGEIRLAADDLLTGNKKRDRRMHDETLATGEHPYLRYFPTAATSPEGDGPPDIRQGASRPVRILGRLEIRGVTRDVELQAEARLEGARLVVDGKLEIPFLDYGVPDPSFFLARVEKVVHATFHLEAIP